MCLSNVTKHEVSDGTVKMYKVFEYSWIFESIVSPFYKMRLLDCHVADENRVPYQAKRVVADVPMFLEMDDNGDFIYDYPKEKIDSFFNDYVRSFDAANAGFVHGYLDEETAYNEIVNYYINVHCVPMVVECTIPKGVEYYVGIFDGDPNTKVIASEYVMLDSLKLVHLNNSITPIEGRELHEQCDYDGERTLKKDIEYVINNFVLDTNKDFMQHPLYKQHLR